MQQSDLNVILGFIQCFITQFENHCENNGISVYESQRIIDELEEILQ